MENSLYIIIVTYNAEKWLAKCLGSFASLPENWKVIVIDNKSQDKTVEIIKTEYPFIHLIESEKNLGFGQANNVGMSLALKNNIDYVLLLNQDSWIDQENILKLIKASQSNPEFYIVSPIHYTGNGKNLDKGFLNYIKSGDKFINDTVLQNFSQEIYAVDFCNAACWLLPQKTLKEVGGFSPIFFHYGEDNNYVDRIHFLNKKIGIVPKTYFFHDRENRTGSTVFWNDFNKEYRHNILLQVSNPAKTNKKLYSVIIKYLLKTIKYSVTNPKKSFFYFTLLKKLISNITFLKQNIQQSRKTGANFLENK